MNIQTSENFNIVEIKDSTIGYVDRFDSIKELIIIKDGISIHLNGEESRKLYFFLKPPLSQ